MISMADRDWHKKIGPADILLVKKTLADHGVPANDLDDMVGKVLLDLVVRRDAFDPSLPLAPWLYGFARMAAREYRKQARKLAGREVLVADTDVLGVPDSAPDPQVQVISRDRLRLTDELLDELPPEQVEVLLMYEGTKLEVSQVAQALGLPRGTVATRLHHGRKNLAEARRRLEARLAHHGESWGVVPPLPFLFERSREAPDGRPSTGAPSGLGRLDAALSWIGAQLPAFLLGAATMAAAPLLLSRCDAPRPEAITMEPAVAVAEGTTQSAPASPLPSSVPAASASAMALSPATVMAAPEELGLDGVRARLDTARVSLDGGDGLGALATLDRLDRLDRRGLLWVDRELTRIEALVRLQRLPEARARAARLRRVAPETPGLKRLGGVLGMVSGGVENY